MSTHATLSALARAAAMRASGATSPGRRPYHVAYVEPNADELASDAATTPAARPWEVGRHLEQVRMPAPDSDTLDEVLIARARRGDLSAVEALYRQLAAPMFSLARRLCRQREDAEEILQEAFLEVVRSLPRFRGDGSFAGWVRRITASKALMRLRSRGRRRESYFGDDEPSNDDVSSGQSTGGAWTVHDRLDLEAALGRLSATARAVVWLHDVEGYTHDEIAALTGRTASFSKSQLARAHSRLRDWLEPVAGEARCT
jgi:RNA polymerase sigma factor (sigma-70 family)